MLLCAKNPFDEFECYFEQVLCGMEGEGKEKGLYASLRFYRSASFLTFLCFMLNVSFMIMEEIKNK